MYNLRIEVAYLNTAFDQVEETFLVLDQKAHSFLEKIVAYSIKIEAYKAQGKADIAIATALDVLSTLGVELPLTPEFKDVQIHLNTVMALMGDRDFESLADLPAATDPDKLAAMKILAHLQPIAYWTRPLLFIVTVLQQVNLSVRYGNCAISAMSYATYAIARWTLIGDIDSTYRLGKLALSVLNKFDSNRVECMVHYLVNMFARHWQEPLRNTLPLFLENYQVGLRTGDFEQAAWSLQSYCEYAFFSGENLSHLAEECAKYDPIITQLKQDFPLQNHRIIGQTVALLKNKSEASTLLTGNLFKREDAVPSYQQQNNRNALFYVFLNELFLAYLLGNFEQAQRCAEQALAYLDAAPAKFSIPIFHLYQALTQLALYDSLTAENKAKSLEEIDASHQRLRAWAEHAPMNHRHKADLIEAEKSRILGDKIQAIELYDRAISGAKEHQYSQEEALANELAAKFYLDWGRDKIAAVYMQEAYYGYSRWGAKAKAADMENRYPELLSPILQSSAPSTNLLTTLRTIAAPTSSVHASTRHSLSSMSLNQTLDFASILKASQALSSTIQLDDFLRQLSQVIVQNSGADYCALLLPTKAGEWQVRSISTAATTELLNNNLSDQIDLPRKLIHYVKNTESVVAIDDLKTDLPVIDTYLQQKQPKSILCLPIHYQEKLNGILYLSNHQISRVFTEERIAILNFLCTQAAISLANAHLYQQAQHYAEQLEHSQLQTVQSEKMAALGNLVAGVAHEINNPIGFLNGSINNAQNYVQDLQGQLALYQQYHPAAAAPVQENAEDIDLDFVCKDLPKLLSAMKGATNRIKAISTSLRTFSRADTVHKVSANLHEGLDSTLLILKYRLKANENRPAIKVIQDYADLPTIECFPGRLNQVFMNILANAIDVFDEVAEQSSFAELSNKPQAITIKTAVLTEQSAIEIIISDNGKGMPDAVKSKIFDHLFTTKGVGKGTGLGLAISQQIVVDAHGGILDVASELGQGTQFRIQLPF